MASRIVNAFGWGIVGTGYIAQQFAADLAHAPGARVAAVCSRDKAKADQFAARYSATGYDDLSRMLADPEIDAVYIASPNSAHFPQTLAAIRAAKPVLTEKPLATNAAHAAEIRAEAAAAGVFAMEAMWTRFLPAVAEAKRQVDAGAIGRISQVTADLSYRHDPAGGGRLFDPALGGGAALDLGVYPLSLTIHFLGLPQEVSGRWFAAPSGVDLRTEFRLRFEGAEAHLSCGFDRDGANTFLIEGSQGAIRLEAPFLKAQRLSLVAPGPLGSSAARLGGMAGIAGKIARRLPLPGITRQDFSFSGGGLQFQAMAVMEAVRNGRTDSAIMPLADSEAVLQATGTVLARPAAGQN